LSAEPPPGFYRQAAADLTMSEKALRVALHRLRRRFGAKLREEIARTVSHPEEVDEEIRHLSAVVGE
jgi:RNA polymerase sigma-70 factor (ECF subfamily)